MGVNPKECYINFICASCRAETPHGKGKTAKDAKDAALVEVTKQREEPKRILTFAEINEINKEVRM